jgi:hypothetical protein
MDKATAKFKLQNLIFEMDYYSRIFDSYTYPFCKDSDDIALERSEFLDKYKSVCDEYSKFSDDLFDFDRSLWMELMVELGRIGR